MRQDRKRQTETGSDFYESEKMCCIAWCILFRFFEVDLIWTFNLYEIIEIACFFVSGEGSPVLSSPIIETTAEELFFEEHIENFEYAAFASP